MDNDLRRRIARRLPAVGWREAKLEQRQEEAAALRERLGKARSYSQRLRAEKDGLRSRADQLTAELAGVRAELAAVTERPSFHHELRRQQRTMGALSEIDTEQRHPLFHIPYKLRNYRVAHSHGVAAPEVFGSWTDARDIDVAALPDRFVLKADRGHSGWGVLPLRRVGADRYELLDGTRGLTGGEVVEALATRPFVKGPYFAEEVLVQPGGGPIPDDLKVYAAYGEVLHVLLRRMPRHADSRTALYRYLDGDGNDLGGVAARRKIDPTIPVPPHLEEVVAVARHLSRAMGVPFCRVDVYDTDRGVVLGEVTREPGGAQRYSADHDERMGAAWERARWRVHLDVLAGRPPGVVHGSHPAPDLYPAGHVSRLEDPGSWAVRHASCAQWCLPGPPGSNPGVGTL